MSSLADAVLPLIRTRAEVYRRGVANHHGSQMHDAIDLLEAALPSTPPAEAYKVVHGDLSPRSHPAKSPSNLPRVAICLATPVGQSPPQPHE